MKRCSYQHVVLVSSGRLCCTDVDVFTGEYMFKLKANEKKNFNYYRPRRLCFYMCLSVQRGVSVPLHAGIHIPRQTPPLSDTPPRQTPPRQIPPWADTPGQTPPPADTPPARHPSLPSACWDTVNKRAVRILLECILIFN